MNSTFAQHIKYTSPEFLKLGDTIAIVAPAGIVKQPEAIKKAKQQFEQWGFKVILGKNVFKRHHHFAGTDAERLADMQWALNHPNIKAIWCARGGYGSSRIIDDLDFTPFIKNPKWLIGYSDITVFHNHIHNLGIQTLHAPMAINFKEDWTRIKESMMHLKEALLGTPQTFTLKANANNSIGQINGALVGGNLTLLNHLLGSESSIDTTGKIVFFEEIGEHKYHIDRMLRALDRAGYFKNCAGILVGDFTHIKRNSPDFGQSIEEMILSIVKDDHIPVIFDFPAGHNDKNLSLFLGKEIQINSTATEVKIND